MYTQGYNEIFGYIYTAQTLAIFINFWNIC